MLGTWTGWESYGGEGDHRLRVSDDILMLNHLSIVNCVIALKLNDI